MHFENRYLGELSVGSSAQSTMQHRAALAIPVSAAGVCLSLAFVATALGGLAQHANLSGSAAVLPYQS